MNNLEIKIINRSGNPLPAYATVGSSGMDVRANLNEPTRLEPLQRALIPTGLYVEIAKGYEAQMRSRSGLAINHGLACLNSPGTIDSDYRGELRVILVNLSNEVQTIEPGDRIAQLVFQKIEKVQLVEVSTIDETSRGTGGFGHTGKQ